MTAHSARPLGRLHIPPPLTSQSVTLDNQPLFSPAIPTSRQMAFHPAISQHAQNMVGTPMQASFMPQNPRALHRAHPSIVQLAAAGIAPPFPMTPAAQANFPPHLLMNAVGAVPQTPGFAPRSRRAPSISTGGPPRAILGGPQPKATSAAAGVSLSACGTMDSKVKGKKIIVKLPVEGESTERLWVREPIPTMEIGESCSPTPPECTSIDAYPPSSSGYVPNTIDVFLPGKSAWDALRHWIMEEKLARLGVGLGLGQATGMHLSHGRAASVSSPADPALLHFKLNRLQQAQNSSTASSLSTSPAPRTSSESPQPSISRFPQSRHGQSMSLAQPGSAFFQHGHPFGAFNPFGPTLNAAPDHIFIASSPHNVPSHDLYAPQGIVPSSTSLLSRSGRESAASSRPDFNRGFGVDIPEEDEPEEERRIGPSGSGNDDSYHEDADHSDGEEADDATVPARSRMHSRHASKLSAALSLRSLGGRPRSEGDAADLAKVDEVEDAGGISFLSEQVAGHRTAMDDLVGEWTGSEDLRDERSDVESAGEWSNPSDEERARQRRLHRTGVHETQQPRRLPEFPRPPLMPAAFAAQPVMMTDNDIVSNPSDEEARKANTSQSGSTRVCRPLPPIPGHSRFASGANISGLSSANHSRSGSGQRPSLQQAILGHNSGQFLHPAQHSDEVPLIRTPVESTGFSVPEAANSLNPHAQAFVFGGRAASLSGFAFQSSSAPGTHGRQMSVGTAKALNAAAQEFKPLSFTFQPPAGLPTMTFAPPAPPSARPLPQVPVVSSPARAVQGREKRIRRSSSADSSGGERDSSRPVSREGRDNITTFKFPFALRQPALDVVLPPTDASTSAGSLNPAAKEFTFRGVTSILPVTTHPRPVATSTAPLGSRPESSLTADNGDSLTAHVTVALAAHLREPPQPASAVTPTHTDFQSTKTVPASLFKALGNQDASDGPTRPTVRSRLSSRDMLDMMHTTRSSLDDINVPSISRKVSKALLIQSARPVQSTDDDLTPGAEPLSPPLSKGKTSSDDSLSSHSPMSGSFSSYSKRRRDQETLARRIEEILDEKLNTLRQGLIEDKSFTTRENKPVSLEALAEITALNARLEANATRAYDDSREDARGELDFDFIKATIEQSHRDTRTALRTDMQDWLHNARARDSTQPSADYATLMRTMQELNQHGLQTISGFHAQLASRIDTISEFTKDQPQRAGELLAEVLTTVQQHLEEMRPSPLDVDLIVGQLSQMVKSHIIDAATDKREAAMLIVQHLAPVLESAVVSQTLDTDAVAGQLAAEINRIVPPVDQHALKEQVADLVVERLDSRLAVRDKTNNPDALATRVLAVVVPFLDPIAGMEASISSMTEAHHALARQTDAHLVQQSEHLMRIAGLPASLTSVSDAITTLRSELADMKASSAVDIISPALALLQSRMDDLHAAQQQLGSQHERSLANHNDILVGVAALPDLVRTTADEIRASHSELLVSAANASERDEQVRSLAQAKASLELAVAKSDSSAGRLTADNHALNSRAEAAEADARLSRVQMEELRASLTAKEIAMVKADARVAELEATLSQALSRSKAAELAAQNSQTRAADLELANRGLVVEKHQLQAKVDSLTLKIQWAERDKEGAIRTLADVQKDRDAMASQQHNWDDMRRTAQQVETLAKLMQSSENEELRELRRIKDRSKVVEGEHQALQKRYKDQETKLANLERVRQSLASVTQKSAEWEKRAKDLEIELESVHDQLERSEESRQQFDADYALLKALVQAKEMDELQAKDRERTLRNDITQLDSQVAGLQQALEDARKSAQFGSSYKTSLTNGHGSRPDSRNTVYPGDARSGPNTPKVNGAVSLGPVEDLGVWSSMHAPRAASYRGITYTRPAHGRASPTPSIVSTVTQQDDGWWE